MGSGGNVREVVVASSWLDNIRFSLSEGGFPSVCVFFLLVRRSLKLMKTKAKKWGVKWNED